MHTPLRQSVIFLSGSVLGGVLIALILLRIWPDLARPTAPGAAPTQSASSAGPGMSAATRPVDPAAIAQPLALETGGIGGSLPLAVGTLAPAVQLSAPAVVSIYTRRAEPPVVGIEQMLGAPIQPRYRDGLGS